MSLNIQGVGGTQEIVTLCTFIELVHPDIILVEGTVINGEKDREVFSKQFPSWEMCIVDSMGLSRGFSFSMESTFSKFYYFFYYCRDALGRICHKME